MNKPPEGRCHPAQKPGGGPGQDVQRPPGPGAEQKKISRCPQQQAQGHVQPHPAVAEDDPAEKEHPAGPHPKQEVQNFLEGPAGQGEADQAEQIIQQPHAQPHGQPGKESGDLLLKGDAHPRKRRPRKLPWRGSSSS